MEGLGTVTILDTQTGETVIDSSTHAFYWADGNGSCDCNREMLFGIDTEAGVCLGCSRFLIIKHDYPDYSLDEFNSGYHQDLIDKHLKG
jgi:hypothetical protein